MRLPGVGAELSPAAAVERPLAGRHGHTFTATRVCTRANSIFDELDTTTQVVGLGTITLGRRSIYEAAAAAAAAKKSEEGGPAAASVVPPIRNRPSVSLPPIRNRPSVSLRPHDVLPPIGWCGLTARWRWARATTLRRTTRPVGRFWRAARAV